MARRVMTGIGSVLVLFALVRGVPAQQPGANQAGRGAQAPRESRVVRLDPAFDAIVPPGALIERVGGGFGFAEGPVWTSQGSLLFSDIPGNTIAGIPDGLKLDAAGNLFGTGPGGVWIISPEGKALGRIEPPEVPANVAWGDDGKTLYMTARSSVYRIRLNTSGKQPCCP